MKKKSRVQQMLNFAIVMIPIMVAAVAIVLVCRYCTDNLTTRYLCICALTAIPVLVYAIGKKTRCKKCHMYFGLRTISKVEIDRKIITWTEKKNIKGLANNSYCDTVHGELIGYDVETVCRYCKDHSRMRMTVRKRT